MEKIIAILLTLIISITALGNETIKIVAQETNKIVTEGSKSNSEKNDEIIFDLEEESIELGTKEYVALNYEFKSEGEKILSWESDDESIAIVDRGVVQGKKSGSTKVKVYSNDILLDECEVIVREEKERESSRSYQDYIELNKGTIYTIKNTSKDTIMIYEGYGSNFKVDEIIYSSSGEVESYYKGKGTSIFLGAGKTAKIKVIEGEGIYTTTAKGKYLLLTDGQGDVFKEIKFSNGSYRIKNNSDEAISIGNINGEKIDGYIESDYWGPDFFYSEGGPGSIQPEETAVFSSSAGETVEFYFPKEYKVDVEYSSKPAVDKIILQSDMVYDFSKSLDKSYRLFSSKDEKGEETSFKVEFIEYEEDNDLLNLGYISNYGTTGSGRYTNLEIRKIYGSIIMMLPYGNKEFISKREEKDPLVKQIDLFKDKHYIIKNNTSNDINMSHFSSDINIIAYNDKGSIVDCKSDNFETGYNNRKIIAKGKSKIGGVEDKGFILIPYEGFTVEEIETPVWGNMEIEANKKVKIKNTTGDVTALHGSGMYKYAYKVYSANGKLEYEGDTLASLYLSNILPNQTVEVTLLEGNSASLLMEYSLLPESALKRPIVKSVMMINGNKEIDISKNYVKINKNSKEAKKIRVDVNWNGKKAKEVRLQQGSSYISSEDGNFDIVFGKEFNETDNIYAIAVSQDDKVSTPVLLNTQLKNISNSITGGNDTGSVNLGQVSATTIPEKVPFVGAEKLDINYSNIKFTAQYDEKKEL